VDRAVGTRRDLIRSGRALALPTVVLCLAVIAGSGSPPAVSAAPDVARILIGAADTLDPAAQGDIGSAAVSAQLFEGLTGIDGSLQARPALAESWRFEDGGRVVVFTLREGLRFSDGSPLTAQDVVRSWLRLVDPDAPSPLVSLIGDVENALAYARGDVTDPGSVGLEATGREVRVRLVRPATDFPAIVAGPTFAVVPPGIDDPSALTPAAFVGSGGYVLEATAVDATTLLANEHYWAGPPAIATIELVHDLAGTSPVTAFEDGEVDVAEVFGFDAPWIVFDPALGPQLRRIDGLTLEYYGFDTSEPPFDDVRVRQAVARAVDWRRLIALAASDSSRPATGMVPPGIPGRSDADFLPDHDPEGARELLAEAGFPGGRGFPSSTLLTFGGGLDEAVLAEIRRELGIEIAYETMGDGYFERLADDPPEMWSMGWVADYPGPNDFLGILLGTGSSNNYGRWSSADFDAAIEAALAATTPAATREAFDRAEEIVRDEVPTIPVSYDVTWALTRTGLLGAHDNGLGILRMAGLAWAD
jgi:oligopeptide transport system substrate-binding protein